MAYSGGGGGGGKMSAVDAILAEAADLIALEQIAKLNTAHLAAADDDSALPSSLESRFRKLKSLPAAPSAAHVRALGRSVTAPHPTLPDPPPRPTPPPPQESAPTPPAPAAAQEEQPPTDKKGESSPPPPPQQQQQPRPPATAPAAAQDGDDDEDLDKLFGSGHHRGRPTLRERNRGRDDDDDDDDDGGSLSPPPPRQACCFGFSPRKPPTAKGKKKVHGSRDGDVLGVDAGEWGDENRRMVTELKEQQRKLKKALEEQVKVSRETAKMASWVKQASARMTHTAAIDDLLSDCDDDDEELK